MKKEHVIQSPLINLLDKFEQKEQVLKNEDFFIFQPDEEKDTYWAVPAQFKILGDDEFLLPEGMKVIKNGSPLDFIKDFPDASTGWKWTRMKQVIQPEIYPETREFAYKNWISLPQKNSFLIREIYLPKGETKFEILAGSQKKALYSPEIYVYLDNKRIKNIVIDQRRNYSFVFTVEAGNHQIKIDFQKSHTQTPHDEQEFLILDEIRISPVKDFILILNAEGNNLQAPSGNFKAIYPISEDPYFRRLHQIQNGFYLWDSGSGEDPYYMKKKFKVGNQTFSTIFAPPESRLQFSIKIPKSGILDFGYGLLKEAWTLPGDGVKFKIIVERKGISHTIFTKHLNPYQRIQDRKVFFKKIDLSSYQNSNVIINFITENNINSKNDLSCWFNPVIFSKEKENKVPSGYNVILVSIDTLRADHLGCYGYQKNTSPNLDMLAADSILFERCYSHSPLTLPSHMSMLTSLYPVSHQLYDNTSEAGLELDPTIITLADLIRENNYFTRAITGGAWVSAIFGFAKGFDLYMENTRNVDDNPEHLFKQTKNWIQRYKSQNFFLFLHTYEVHGPFTPPSPYNTLFTAEDALWKGVDPYKIISQEEGQKTELSDKERENLIALYDGEIRYTDEAFIKPLVLLLKELNLYDKTMIIVTSDHGEEFYEHQGWLHFDTLYEEVLHVPLIIKLPGSNYRGNRISNISREIDIGPTILDVLGINFSGVPFEGRSLIGLIKKREKESRLSIGYKFYPQYNNNHQYVFLLQRISGHKDMSKIILNENIPKNSDSAFDIEFFHLDQDPLEKHNLANIQRIQTQRFMENIRQYYTEAKSAKDRSYKSGKIDKELRKRLKALGYIR
jgi:arylsulfatase A-like enzyme